MTRDDATRTCAGGRRAIRVGQTAASPPLSPPLAHLKLVRGLLNRGRHLDVEGEDARAHVAGALHVLLDHLAGRGKGGGGENGVPQPSVTPQKRPCHTHFADGGGDDAQLQWKEESGRVRAGRLRPLASPPIVK